MNLPFGDQTGLEETESTSRTGVPRRTGILYTCGTPPDSAPATVIHFPSGDHDGSPVTSSELPRISSPIPSDVVQCSADLALARTTEQILLPSGEATAEPHGLDALCGKRFAATPSVTTLSSGILHNS